MANQYAQQFLFNFNRMMTLVDCRILIGATGAVTSFSGNNIQNVVRDNTGLYTITMKQPYNAFLGMSQAMIAPVAGTGSGINTIEATGVPNTTVQTSTISIQTLDGSNAVANPASGSTVLLQIMVRNSSVVY